MTTRDQARRWVLQCAIGLLWLAPTAVIAAPVGEVGPGAGVAPPTDAPPIDEIAADEAPSEGDAAAPSEDPAPPEASATEPAPAQPPVEPAPEDSAASSPDVAAAPASEGPVATTQAEPAPPPAASEPEPAPPASDPPLKPRPRHRWIYSNLLGVRYNPLGLVNEFTTGYRYQLVDKQSLLFNDSFIAAQLHTFLTPAYSGGGPKIDIQPAAVLNLSATYDYFGFFSAFGSFQSFRSPNAVWSDTTISRLADNGTNYVTGGHVVTLSALLQGKVKKVAIRDNVKFYWNKFTLRDGDTVWYWQTLDTLMPNGGWAVTNDLDVLYLFDFGLTLGARYTLTDAFYRDSDFPEGEPRVDPNGVTHRVGPAIIYTFYNRPDRRFNQPSLVILAQWWAAHRYRTGVDVTPAIPYFVLGFTFQGDLLPNPASWNKRTESKRRRRRTRI
ncbi:MAG: hypothetical protein KC636_06075 [Myxococcales bacterium]|nr:hypothetical protein [Myxococcales bacterium]